MPLTRQGSDAMVMNRLLILLGASLLVICPLPVSQAQVPTTITSSGLNTRVGSPTTLAPGTVNYDITGGTRPGNGPNLLHSFGEFSVATKNIANFLNETGLPTTNILSRVTGGHTSNIFGTLQTTNFGTANLYLINPAGVILGPTAQLNVAGSVHVSTADYLRLSDNVRFNAMPGPSDALLSAAPVAAFGFLGPTVAPISVQGGPGTPPLAVPPGHTLSLIGGDLTVSGRTLSAPGGQINLASGMSRGEVLPSGRAHAPEQPPDLNVDSFTRLGNISLSQGASIDTSANAAGSIFIRGGKLLMDSSSIMAITVNGPGGAIDATSSPATVAITADTVALNNGIQIRADTHGAAPAGEIPFNVGPLTPHPGTNFAPPNPGNPSS